MRDEIYPPKQVGVPSTELAQRLSDEGLIYAVNRLVLHNVGLALGVQVRDVNPEMGTGHVVALTLSVADDGVITYDDPEGVQARALAKLRAAGHGLLAAELADLDP